jgi:hypothetical protein
MSDDRQTGSGADARAGGAGEPQTDVRDDAAGGPPAGAEAEAHADAEGEPQAEADAEGEPPAGTEAEADADPGSIPAGRRWTVWAVAAVVALAVAFGGGATWARGRLPFTSGAPSCWGVNLSSLFPHRATSTQDVRPYGDTTPECRIMVGVERDRKVDDTSDVFYADLDVLDRDSADGGWSQDGLTGGLYPLGPGLTGMADDRDAWVELPRACFATNRYDDSAPYIVRLSYRPRASILPVDDDGANGDGALKMAKAAVRLANRAASSRHCAGTLPEPTLPAAEHAASETSARDACGLPASALPAKVDLRGEYRATGRSVSVCTLISDVGDLDLITLSGDLGLSRSFDGVAETYGPGRLLVPGRTGYGGTNLATADLDCGKQYVTFVARDRDDIGGFDAARVLAGYAAAQGPRFGCGKNPVRVSG